MGEGIEAMGRERKKNIETEPDMTGSERERWWRERERVSMRERERERVIYGGRVRQKGSMLEAKGEFIHLKWEGEDTERKRYEV